jgi:hypothetical protein
MSAKLKATAKVHSRGEEIKGEKGERIGVIRTSDRINFKSCRRKWDFSSHLRQNLGTKITADPLWLGSGMHYALEDYHGDNIYGSPDRALSAFAYAYGKKYPDRIPEDWAELLSLGRDMMAYYPIWLVGRDPLPTYELDKVKQLEVNIKIEIPMELLPKKLWKLYDKVYYSMQLDRVHQDEYGQVWIVEYKSAKNMITSHFLTDPQVSTYMWGASIVYDEPIAGVIYQQHRKTLPKPPRVLLNGTVSTAQNQATSHRLYRQTLIEVYGEVKKAPAANIDYLNELTRGETELADDFIRRDYLNRNAKTGENEAQKILLEAADMLDPDLPLYPNPTRDGCGYMCNFVSPCVSMDDGSDWRAELEAETMLRPSSYDDWRTQLPKPEKFDDINMKVAK